MQIKECKIIPISSTKEDNGQLIEERRFFLEATMDDKTKVLLNIFNIMMPEEEAKEVAEPDEEPEETDEEDEEDEEEKEEVPVAKKRTGNFI